MQPSLNILTIVQQYQNVFNTVQYILAFHWKHITFSEFQWYWSQSILDVIINLAIQSKWDPNYFINVFGAKEVTIQDCETEKTFPHVTTVQAENMLRESVHFDPNILFRFAKIAEEIPNCGSWSTVVCDIK